MHCVDAVLSARLLLPGMTATPIGYNTVKRVKGKGVADARAASLGGDPAAMMGNNAHPPSVVADLLCDSVDSGGPFYVICPGSTDVDEFKVSYQREFAVKSILPNVPLTKLPLSTPGLP